MKDWKTLLTEKYHPHQTDFTGSVYTYFDFKDDYGIPSCHCTHKYFGYIPEEMNDEKINKVIEIIDEYFKELKKKERLWYFNQFDLFGPDKDVPVMRSRRNDNKFLGLKGLLDKIKTDNYPEYKPHITLKKTPDELSPEDKKFIVMEPIAYKLDIGDFNIKTWGMV